MSKTKPFNTSEVPGDFDPVQPENVQIHHHVILQYLGGSGKEVYHELQRRQSGPISRLKLSSRATVLDSDAAQMTDIPASDYYLLDNVPAYDLVEQMQLYPETVPGWQLLGDPEALWNSLGPDDDLSRGAPFGERRLGLMSFWYHSLRNGPKISDFLTEAVQDLKAYSNTKVMRHNGQQPTRQRHELTINQSYSACGGTGSAIAVYLVDVMRPLLREEWGLGKISFEADIMLPTVFLSHVENFKVLQAKAYAFFLELSLRYKSRLQPVILGKVELARYRPPYSRLYYYDGVDSQGNVFSSREQVAQVIHLCQQLRHSSGVFSDTYRSYNQHMPNEWPYIGASAGAYTLHVPVEDMIRQFGYRTGRAVIYNRWLRSQPDEADLAHQAVKVLLNRQPELRNLPAFQHTASGERLQVSTSLFAKRFANIPRQKLTTALQQFERDQVTAVKTSLETLLNSEVQTTLGWIHDWLEPLLNKPGGLPLVYQALITLTAHFKMHFHRLTKQLERKREVYQQWEERRQQQRRNWWGRLTGQPRPAYLDYWHRRLEFKVDELHLTTQLDYTEQILNLIAGLLQSVNGWQVAFDQLVTRLEEGEQAFLRDQTADQSIVMESVLDDHDIEELYATGRDSAEHQAAEGLHLALLEAHLTLSYRHTPADSQISEVEVISDRWTLLTPDGIARHLAYARQFWYHLQALSIEQVLVNKGRTGPEVLEDLEIKSAPLIAADEVLHIPAEQRLIVVGSEHGATGLFHDATSRPSLNLVATGNKHQIACLSTVHGINVLQLRQTPAWKRAYEEAMAQGRLLHVIPEFDPTTAGALVTENGKRDQTTPAPGSIPLNGQGRSKPKLEVEEVDDVSPKPL